MKLIDTDELLRAARVKGIAGESAAKFLMLLLRFRRINKIYAENSMKSGMDFIDSMNEELGIRYEISNDELDKIPLEGAFITVSNHPFGGIDGLLLIKMIASIRPDYKVLPNFLLQRMEPVSKNIFAYNPFTQQAGSSAGEGQLEDVFTHLEEGKSIGVFPAGEVSCFNQDIHAVTDPQWQYTVLKMIKKANVPVVPIYFQGKNSRFFQLLGRIHPKLQTLKLPSEFFKQRKRVINIRIGSPISSKDQYEFSDIARYGRYLRTKTYALGTSLEVNKFFSVSRGRLKREEPI
ncbi:MAG: lysophospholipid acyltransferase family protein, partial [Bacteroidales bacterium]|nr:lysophospholipid acyltransferase family protein [Bacteroidales bacterium]